MPVINLVFSFFRLVFVVPLCVRVCNNVFAHNFMLPSSSVLLTECVSNWNCFVAHEKNSEEKGKKNNKIWAIEYEMCLTSSNMCGRECVCTRMSVCMLIYWLFTLHMQNEWGKNSLYTRENAVKWIHANPLLRVHARRYVWHVPHKA